jgi:hypothetical protein
VAFAAALPGTATVVEDYLKLLGISQNLPDATRLGTKSELVAAVRDATVTLEETVRRRSKLSARGADLMDKALSFEYDRATRRLTRRPRIRLNSLKTETKRNEQDGIRLIAMGLMRGARNIFAHSSGSGKFYHCLNIVTVAEWVLRQIVGDGGTVAEDRTMFKLIIPKLHRTHDVEEVRASPSDEVTAVRCRTCNVEFAARWRPVITD